MPHSSDLRRVFISSTAQDLTAYRAKVVDVLERLEQRSVRMEVFGARPDDPVSECKALAAGADAVVVIVAHRYGWVPSVAQGGDGAKSITRLEVEAALAAKRPVFTYLVDENHSWPQGMQEQDR